MHCRDDVAKSVIADLHFAVVTDNTNQVDKQKTKRTFFLKIKFIKTTASQTMISTGNKKEKIKICIRELLKKFCALLEKKKF